MQISTFLPEIDRESNGLISSIVYRQTNYDTHSHIRESLVKCMDMALYVLSIWCSGS